MNFFFVYFFAGEETGENDEGTICYGNLKFNKKNWLMLRDFEFRLNWKGWGQGGGVN